ncbi:ABC transporter permease [Granulosicoccus sp. 3-233]|uniref:ABC transporter permease n=1 Tax=Granulosicoccus sp. 3-233 TaxID=3417969 RepID=UPI003D32C6EE
MSPTSRWGQRILALCLMVLFLLPVVLGLGGTLLPALGLTPELAPGNGFAQILNDPRFVPALSFSVFTGIVSTVLILAMTLLTLVCVHGTRWWSWMSALMPPVLAVPHAALAIGLIFLLAPSGELVRLISPGLSGWERPPQAWVVPDSVGWSLIIGLVIKETPFLLLAAVSQLSALNVSASLRIGRTLGYAPARCWSRLILPRLYPRIRLTLLIILAFNLTVVDMAILLGPGNPPTLAVLLMSLVNDPGSRAAASAGAVLLGVLVALCFIAMMVVEWAVARIAARRRQSGERGHGMKLFRRLGMSAVMVILMASMSSLLLLLLWSFTRRWRFPDALPSQWTLANWTARSDMLLQPAMTTLGIAVTVTVLSLLSAIIWLEFERRAIVPRMDSIWFVPLLIPQVSLLFGWQAVALWAGIDGQWWSVVYTHWLYTLPYVILILAVAWRELAPQWGQAAHVLGAGYWRVLLHIRLPLLRRPLCQAAAVAVAVSVAQYLPTLLMGAGRHSTLATELVTSFGGVDRRVIAALAVLQSLLPLMAFVLALIYPVWRSSRVSREAVPSSSRAPDR